MKSALTHTAHLLSLTALIFIAANCAERPKQRITAAGGVVHTQAKPTSNSVVLNAAAESLFAVSFARLSLSIEPFNTGCAPKVMESACVKKPTATSSATYICKNMQGGQNFSLSADKKILTITDDQFQIIFPSGARSTVAQTLYVNVDKEDASYCVAKQRLQISGQTDEIEGLHFDDQGAVTVQQDRVHFGNGGGSDSSQILLFADFALKWNESCVHPPEGTLSFSFTDEFNKPLSGTVLADAKQLSLPQGKPSVTPLAWPVACVPGAVSKLEPTEVLMPPRPSIPTASPTTPTVSKN